MQDGVLDLVKKTEQAKDKPTRSRHAIKIGKKNHKASFVSIPSLFHPNSCNENLINQIKFPGNIIKNTFEA